MTQVLHAKQDVPPERVL
jgi:hypothetical protein